MSRYFQINRGAYLERKRIDKVWNELSDDDKTALNILEREMPLRAERVLGDKAKGPLTGLGHVGLLEVINKLALWHKSIEKGGKNKGQLASMHVVKEALEDI